jgi:hypothetical protein
VLMKQLNNFFLVAIGALFIFSGAIKINDPVGTAIKLEEYFEVFSTDFTSLFQYLTPYSLYFSLFLCAFEIILGVALIVNFKRKAMILSSLAMIVFFTFLTFYSAYFNKVTDCGCFGAVIKLTPWQSFSKDIALLLPLLLLSFQLKKFKDSQNVFSFIAVLSATIASFGVGIQAVRHLPLIDTSDYKVGNHIPSLMKPQEPCQFRYTMTKDGKTFEFDTYPTDTTYSYQAMTTLNPEKCMPKITDYNIWKDTVNYTQESFVGNKLIFVLQDVNKASAEGVKKMVELAKNLQANAASLQMVVFTASGKEEYEKFKSQTNLQVPYYFADGKVLKTMLRAKAGLILLQNGNVKSKWHENDVPKGEEVVGKIN